MNKDAATILKAMEDGHYVSFENSLFKLLDEETHKVICCTLQELKDEIRLKENA